MVECQKKIWYNYTDYARRTIALCGKGAAGMEYTVKGGRKLENIRISRLFDLEHTMARSLFERFEYPWEVLPHIKEFILETGKTLSADEYYMPAENVWISKKAKVAPTASIEGPVIICEDADIKHCAFIRGGVLVGRGAVVGNSTEVKNAILFDEAKVPHFNYMGDSVFGHGAHMGAGCVTSNLKSDKTLVVVKGDGYAHETGLKKFGAMLGDFVEIGCNSVLNPGTVIGRRSSVYPTSSVRGVIPEDHIYKAAGNIVPRKKS